MKRCRTKNCRGHVTDASHSPWCSKCRSRRFRENHPLKYFFNLLRCGAKRRGKEFSLTFAEYEAFCLKTNYHLLKGKSSLSMSVDRKRNSEGYHADNLACITIRENCRKDYVPRLREYMKRGMAEQEAA